MTFKGDAAILRESSPIQKEIVIGGSNILAKEESDLCLCHHRINQEWSCLSLFLITNRVSDAIFLLIELRCARCNSVAGFESSIDLDTLSKRVPQL